MWRYLIFPFPRYWPDLVPLNTMFGWEEGVVPGRLWVLLLVAGTGIYLLMDNGSVTADEVGTCATPTTQYAARVKTGRRTTSTCPG